MILYCIHQFFFLDHSLLCPSQHSNTHCLSNCKIQNIYRYTVNVILKWFVTLFISPEEWWHSSNSVFLKTTGLLTQTAKSLIRFRWEVYHFNRGAFLKGFNVIVVLLEKNENWVEKIIHGYSVNTMVYSYNCTLSVSTCYSWCTAQKNESSYIWSWPASIKIIFGYFLALTM